MDAAMSALMVIARFCALVTLAQMAQHGLVPGMARRVVRGAPFLLGKTAIGAESSAEREQRAAGETTTRCGTNPSRRSTPRPPGAFAARG